MWTNVQFSGSLGPNASGRWFTHSWPVAWHVVWYLMPTSTQGGPALDVNVTVERSSATLCTYWINARNLTPANVTFEARYAVLN